MQHKFHWEVLRKMGLPFQKFCLFRIISSGTSQKVVFHLHPKRDFRNFLVNGKHPVRHTRDYDVTRIRKTPFSPSTLERHRPPFSKVFSKTYVFVDLRFWKPPFSIVSVWTVISINGGFRKPISVDGGWELQLSIEKVLRYTHKLETNYYSTE